jgi:hypothetical protein
MTQTGDYDMRKIITLAAFGLVLAAGYSFASSERTGAGVSQDQWLPMDQVAGQLLADGYRLYEIEIDDGRYEVEAVAPDGRRVEIYIHPLSGEFLKVESHD